MCRISARLLKIAARWLGPIVIALPLVGCDRTEHQTPAAESSERQASATARNYEAILARRGWARAELAFGQVDHQVSVESDRSGEGLRNLQAVGPFRLGMSVDAVRSAGRRAHMYSSGGFAPNGVMETAWCAPPREPNGAALILAPKELTLNSCRPLGTCTSYYLRFTPIDSRLRLASIYVAEARNADREVNLRRPGGGSDGRTFTPCILTSSEGDRLVRWDQLEERNLIDTLGYPNLDANRLPPAVRAMLDRWERSVTVRPDGDCCDLYSLTPMFDGYWQSGGNFVIGYSLAVGGYGPHWSPYILVVGPGGSIVWNGATEEYERHGLSGAQHMARELD
jgi:hypothetical protein